MATAPESSALAGAGAAAWATGSQACSGNRAAFMATPVVMTVSAAMAAGVGRRPAAMAGM